MNAELPGLDILLEAGLLDELPGQFGRFPHANHPADDKAAEDIEHHVEVKVAPLGRTAQLGDVPTPELIGRGGQEFRFLVGRSGELIATFAWCAIFVQDSIHRSGRAKILVFIQQSRLNRSWRAILKALGVEHDTNRLAFVGTQGASGSGTRDRRRPRNTLPIKSRARYAQEQTGRLDADGRSELFDGFHYRLPSGSGVSIGRPNSAATFFWTSITMSALRNSSTRRWFSRRSCWFSSTTGSYLDLGPRLWGDKAWRTPASRSHRQVFNKEEYNPSRRSTAPIPPEPLAASTSCKMRSLYSAVNRRRLAWATTSGSGRSEAVPGPASVELRLASLRSASLRPTDATSTAETAETFWLFIKRIPSRPVL